MLSIFSCVFWPFAYLLWRMSVQVLCQFLSWSFIFLLLSCRGSLYLLDISLLSDIWFTNIFSHSIDCFFTLLILSFDVQKFLMFTWSCLSIFAFLTVLLVSYSRNHCQIQRHEAFPLCFFLGVSDLMFRSLIHFELAFVYGVSDGSSFILLHVDIQFSKHHLLERLFFPHWVVLVPLLKIIWPYMWQFISGLCILFHLSKCQSLCQYHTGVFCVFFGRVGSSFAACGLSLVAASRSYSLMRRPGFVLWWLLLLWSTGSRHAGFSSCGSRA